MKEALYDLMYASEPTYWWYVARRRIIMTQVERVLQARRDPSVRPCILDYGCGTGLHLLSLSTLGEAYGLEMSERAVALCAQRGLRQVAHLPGGLPESTPFGQSFDLITMLDVLEHIDDDVLLLQQVGAWLKPQGVLLITVPAYEFLWSGEDYVSEHRRRYTRRRLSRVVRQAGYDISKLSYFNTLLFPVQVMTILCQRLFAPRSMYRSHIRPLGSTVNALLTRLMAAEHRVLPYVNLAFGGSLLCCARKGGGPW
jgi:SAM-dependent methyltransferase